MVSFINYQGPKAHYLLEWGCQKVVIFAIYYTRIYSQVENLILGFGGGHCCSFMQVFLKITKYIFCIFISNCVFFLNRFTIYFLYCSHDASKDFRPLFHDWIFWNYFNNLIKAGFQEMWLSKFTLRSENKCQNKALQCLKNSLRFCPDAQF